MEDLTRPRSGSFPSPFQIESLQTLGRAAAALILLLACGLTQAQMQQLPGIATVAGNGTAGYAGDGSAAGSAELNLPNRLATDNAGNVFIADEGNNVIREVSFSTGVITTVAGTGAAGYSGDGGLATAATFRSPNGITVDNAGNLYIADKGNHAVRKVTAATGEITTIAGTGVAGYSGDGGAATSAQLNEPDYVSLDGANNLYIADAQNNRIRMVNASTQIITTVAGNGTQGYSGDGGAATSAELYTPVAVVVNASGYIYIADTGNNRVRKVNTGGIITTIAGNGTSGYAGDGGAATSAEIDYPSGLSLDNPGNIYIADALNNAVREVNIGTGTITTVAGNGTAGFSGDNGPALRAEMHDSADVAINFNGNLYIADADNSVIRRVALNASFAGASGGMAGVVENFFLATTGNETISSITAPLSQGGVSEFTVGAITGCTVNGSTSNPSGTICTVPVTFAPWYAGLRNVPLQVVTGAGNINFGLSGMGNAGQAALTPGVISTVAGNGTAGYTGDGGAASSAELNGPNRAVVDWAGNIYIADFNANVIRKVNASTGLISTVAGTGVAGSTGDGGAATSAKLHAPDGLGVDASGNIYIGDSGNCRIRRVTVATGVISTVAGNGTCGYTGDGGAATSAEIQTTTSDIAFDSAGNFYFADGPNNVIRKVAVLTGIITTVAGNGTNGYTGDGGLATSATLALPDGVAFDDSGNQYIADFGNHVVRKVTTATGIITTVAGNGTSGYAGDGGAATSAELSDPSGLALDAAGNLYVADSGNNVLRELNAATGVITTVAGNSLAGYAGDGGAATSAEMHGTADVAVDAMGNLYLSDISNSVIREVTVNQSKWAAANTAYGATAAQSFTLTNIGNASLIIPPPGSGSNPNVSGAFTVSGSSTCPVLNAASSAQAVAAGAACSYVLDFAPTGLGALSGTVTVSDNSQGAPLATQIISATGTGVAAGTTTSLSATPNPAQYGQGSVTATVAPTVGTGVPVGSVRFSVDGTPVGTALNLSGGTATYPFGTIAVGTHTLTAVYTPSNGDFTGSSSSSLNATVTPATLTAGIVGNPTKTYDGTTTATLTSSNYALAGFAGSDGATVTQTAGTYAAAGAGPRTVTAALSPSNFTASGSTNFANYVLPTSATGPGTIAGAPLTVTANNATRVYGTANPIFTGSVSGQINGDTFTESFSTAAVTTSPVGNYAIIPAVAGTNLANYAVTPVDGTLAITQAGSATSLAASAASVHPGQNVTLTATVVSSTTGTPTSNVRFFDGSTALGTAALSGGVATYTGALSAGETHSLTANYEGDTNFSASTSSAVSVAVAAQDFTFGLASGAAASQSVSPGGAAAYKLVATPLYTAFPGTVTFTLTGLPAGATYSFSPSTISATSASTAATLTVQTSGTAQLFAPEVKRKLQPMLLAVMLLPLMGLRRLRKRGVKFAKHAMLGLALLLSMAAMMGLQGCSSSNFSKGGSGSQPQTYNLTATATSGATTHTVNLTLVVQ